jgi:transcriptional antiterminator Rof (Rho-off)
MSLYRPVDGAVYARFELAILRRCTVTLGWRDAGGLAHLERVSPVDLETAAGEEYLHFRTAAGCREKARLDRIVGFRE